MPLSKSTGIALASLGVFALVLAGAVSFLLSRHTTTVEPTSVSAEPSVTYRHPLTGKPTDAAMTDLPWVYAVMVENSYDAWPLSGLEKAFLVIEAPVEGNIPRFEAFFEEGVAVEKIGPVRSARPYYLDWAQEFDALYAHVGGSPAALSLITKNDLRDLNEFFYGASFWRSTNRSAPHNTYTSSDLLSGALAQRVGTEQPVYGTWIFKEDRPLTESPQDLFVDFTSGSVYDLQWRYRADTNTYLRFQNGATTAMATAEIIANNVIVLETDIVSIDNQDRKSIETIGQGNAIVAQDGQMIEAQWRKPSANERLRFYTKEGEEITMNAGITWIEIVDDIAKATGSVH